MTNSVAAGGSSTINGVVYQLLRSLFHVTKLRVTVPLNEVAVDGITIVLEPRGGGGDLLLKTNKRLVVEQIKARSDGGTWSLREVIEDVLPDLFIAIGPGTPNDAVFRFVTEGRMGAWHGVYDGFFRKIRKLDASGDPLADLDDTTELCFKHKVDAEAPFFPDTITERRLFLKVTELISDRPAVKKLNLSTNELYHRVRVLLSKFEFVGGEDIQFVQRSIDAILLAIVDKQDDIPRVRDNLAMELAKASTIGGVEIDPITFLSKNGLDATPLIDWTAHIEKAQQLVNRSIERNRYTAPFDVRIGRLPDVPLPGHVLVLTGESGTGKSWTLNALARRATGPLLPILLESQGNADASLEKCAAIFWNSIHNGDAVLPLSRVAKRLNKITEADAGMGLAILIDGVRSYEEARQLVDQDWETWSSSLVLVCHPACAKSLQDAYPNRVGIYECRNFSWEELHDYLGRRLNTGWAEIPFDVRETLRRPLLAGIYCEEFSEGGWDSPSEYELYQRVWQRLSTGSQSDFPLDSGRVVMLARKLRDGAAYPWSKSQLVDAGFDDAGLARLQRIGWFVEVGEGYRIFHDRLLQWAVARSLCSDLRDGKITANSMVEFVAEQFRNPHGNQQVFLGYIPMDVLWMLNQGSSEYLEVSVRLLESFENDDHHYPKILYDRLVPTLGRCAANAVFRRYCSYGGPRHILKTIAECLIFLDANRIEEFARPLVTSDNRATQRRGITLLGLTACPALLDQMWQIHITGQSDPLSFDEEHSSQLYKETFAALKCAVRVAPCWLCKAIEQSDAVFEPVSDLCYLVAILSDGGTTWYATKRLLFEKVEANKPRSLVSNISRYRDHSEKEWLSQWIGNNVDYVASSAIQALSRLDPDLAVAAFTRMDITDFQVLGRSVFAEIFERHPVATHAAILERMKATDDPWVIAMLFQGRENDVSTAQLDLLLDSLCTAIDLKLKGEPDSRRGLHTELRFLAKIAAPELLQVLLDRRDTVLELMLCKYVLSIGPQIGQFETSLERDPALLLLNFIGGNGLTAITNEFLVKGDQIGKRRALDWASKRPDVNTFQLLCEIIQSDDRWSGGGDHPFPINQRYAMLVLARYGHWESVAEGIKRWSISPLSEMTFRPSPIIDSWVDELRAAVNSSPNPGNVRALGTVGSYQDCPRIHAILDRCITNSELAHACIIALYDLNDRSDDGVLRVSKHLSIENHRYSATRMLQNARTVLAWDAMFEDLKGHFDFVTALNLINRTEHAEAVAEIALSRLSMHDGMDGHSLIKLFLTNIRPQRIRERILRDQRVRELIHQLSAAAEGNFWFVGSKANAIECMAEFAPDLAFAAALQALSDTESHDRERYPSILTNIDRDRGVEWLVEHYPKEQSRLVRVSIGRCLEDDVAISTVLDKMNAMEEKSRVAAAELAGWADLNDNIDAALTKALDDESDDVIRAAIAAKQRRRDRRNVAALTNLIVEEKDHAKRSIYLDALIGLVDPGDDHTPLHDALEKALGAVSEFEENEALEKLNNRRKKLHDEMKKENSN